MVQISKLNGIKVISADSFTIGDVTGAEADTAIWQITHLHVALTKDITKQLGFRKPFLGNVTLCIPTSLVKSIGDVITLDKQLEQIKALPECKHS